MIEDLDLRKDLVNVAQNVVDHQGEDTHLCGTSLVKLDGALAALPFIGLLVPTEVDVVVTEVTQELRLSGFWPDITGVSVEGFHDTPSEEHLDEDLEGKGIPCGETAWDVLGTWESYSGVGDQVTDNSQHSNTSVLQFNVTETFEVDGITIGNDSQWVPESQWNLGTDLVGEGALRRGQDGGTLSLLGRSKGGGASDKGCKDSGLHGCDLQTKGKLYLVEQQQNLAVPQGKPSFFRFFTSYGEMDLRRDVCVIEVEPIKICSIDEATERRKPHLLIFTSSFVTYETLDSVF